MHSLQRGARYALIALSLTVVGRAQTESVDQKIERLRQEYEQRMASMRTEYEGRLAALEQRVQDSVQQAGARDHQSLLEEHVAGLVQEVERKGLSEFGQTTVFDNKFNPALSVVGDFILSASNRSDSFEDLNRFHLRGVEMGIVGRVDPLLAYYVFLHLTEDELELEEAYAVADQWLPDTFTLKFGRFNTDFGKLSRLHEHDLPFVDKPGVLQEFLGGSLRGTGVELHHWFGVGDSTIVRWSAGIVNGLDGDGHAIVGPLAGEHHHDDGEEGEPFGERSLDNFAFNARLTALLDIASESTLQLGGSVAWAPKNRRFTAEDGAIDLSRLLVGMDLTFRWLNESTGEGLTLAAEALYSRQHVPVMEPGMDFSRERVGSFGVYGYAEYLFDRSWSVGLRGDWYQHAEEDGPSTWDAGVFVTYQVNEFNRLRLEGVYVDDDEQSDPFVALMLQWTVILGSHGHGIDW